MMNCESCATMSLIIAISAELALRRQRRFGLVEQIEPAGHEARLEELEKALAV